MTTTARGRPTHARLRARRRFASLAVLVLAGAGAAVLLATARGSQTPPAAHPSVATPAAPVIRLQVAGRTLARLSLARFRAAGVIDTAGLRRAVIAALPRTSTASQQRSLITYVYDRDRTARRAVALARSGGAVGVVRRPVASRVAAPVIAQELRNDCEAAALSILLRSRGVTASQRRLQALFGRSGPLDPQGAGPSKVWGDPDRGFVGRVEGGGAAGGFGVYPGPVAAAARHLGVKLTNLTGRSPQAVYDRLLTGHAVMVWVGLGDGPYDTWQTPQGRSFTVNFNEHTVVLRGIDRDHSISVSNPLLGTAETWSREKFEAMWQLLGRRALST